jgi:hypothetical protein
MSMRDPDGGALVFRRGSGDHRRHAGHPAFSSLGWRPWPRRKPERAGARVVLDGAPEPRFRDRLPRAADVVRADARETKLLTGQAVRSGAL